MSKSIQDALDLPILEDLLKPQRGEDDVDAEEEGEITDDMIENFENEAAVNQMSTALATGNTSGELQERAEAKDHADSMDEVHKETLGHAQDLMDLGYNVDTRSAGRIFETAAHMYKIALDAKNSKRDSQLKAKKLMLESRKLDIMERQKGNTDLPPNAIQAQNVVVEDRNEMIRRLREEAKKTS